MPPLSPSRVTWARASGVTCHPSLAPGAWRMRAHASDFSASSISQLAGGGGRVHARVCRSCSAWQSACHNSSLEGPPLHRFIFGKQGASWTTAGLPPSLDQFVITGYRGCVGWWWVGGREGTFFAVFCLLFLQLLKMQNHKDKHFLNENLNSFSLENRASHCATSKFHCS